MGILMSFLVSIVVLALVAAFFVIVVKLSGKGSPWPGLAPIVLLLTLILGINMTVLHKYSGEKLETLTAKLNNGMTAQMIARVDGDIIRAYGPIEIVDEKGILRESYDLYSKQYDDYREPYRGLFETMTEGKKILASWSTEREVVEDMSKRLVFVKPDGIDPGSTCFIYDIRGMFYGPLLFLGFPLLIVYLLKRRQVHKGKRASELRRMEIENL